MLKFEFLLRLPQSYYTGSTVVLCARSLFIVHKTKRAHKYVKNLDQTMCSDSRR